MTIVNPEQPEGGGRRERYSHGHHETSLRAHATRTADVQAAFFLPYLKPGMSLLDCGCGTGSITIGLAQAVAPGEVVAIDMDSGSIDVGRKLSSEQGMSNIRFEVGDIYRLPFPDESFDAVFSHMVLEHLGDPLAALTEFKRVLKPGGIVGVRDVYQSGSFIEPDSPAIERFFTLYQRVWRQNGGNPDIGKRFPALFREAGLAQVDFAASYETYQNSLDGFGKMVADMMIHRIDSNFGRQVLELSWATQQDLDEMKEAWKTLREDPHFLTGRAACQIVGRKE